MTRCPDCLVPGRCVVQWTAHAAFCDWMRAGGARRDRVIALSADPPADTPDASEAGPPPDAAEAVALVRAMGRCAWRSVDPGCGCGGSRCALRRGAIVGHIDCFDCIRTFGES